MVKNLQKKAAPTDTIRVFDINKAVTEKLVSEVQGGAKVEVSESPLDAVKDAVSCYPSPKPYKSRVFGPPLLAVIFNLLRSACDIFLSHGYMYAGYV